MVKASAVPLVALVGALVLASVVVSQVTPASLLPSPERPFTGYGNPDVRVESDEYPRHATGADDVRVQVDGPPRRIVSQFSSTDEFAYTVVPPERIVFAVDSEIVATADGRRAFVFSKPASVTRSGFQHGVNR